MTDAEREMVLRRARDTLAAALPEAWEIYAYGSFARADEWPDSDIDLAVLLPAGRKIRSRFELISRVAAEVGRDVDIVDLREVGLDLVMEVLRDGRALLTRLEAETIAWESEQITAYADFKPRREALLAMYLQEPLRNQT